MTSMGHFSYYEGFMSFERGCAFVAMKTPVAFLYFTTSATAAHLRWSVAINLTSMSSVRQYLPGN